MNKTLRYYRYCSECGNKFRPTCKVPKSCQKCLLNSRIKRCFLQYGKYKECKTLKEALSKYGVVTNKLS
jgi:hypothetical protein